MTMTKGIVYAVAGSVAVAADCTGANADRASCTRRVRDANSSRGRETGPRYPRWSVHRPPSPLLLLLSSCHCS